MINRLKTLRDVEFVVDVYRRFGMTEDPAATRMLLQFLIPWDSGAV